MKKHLLDFFIEKAKNHTIEELFKKSEHIRNNYDVAHYSIEDRFITITCHNGHSGHLFFHYYIENDDLFFIHDALPPIKIT